MSSSYSSPSLSSSSRLPSAILSSTDDADRELENVFIIYRQDESDVSEAPSASPTIEPDLRTLNYITCPEINSENKGNTHVAFLDFLYNVETVASDLSLEQESEILRVLSFAMVTSIHDAHCMQQQGETMDTGMGTRLRRQLHGEGPGRKLGVESISGGARDKMIGPCSPRVAESQSCVTYEGSLLIAYDDGDGMTESEIGSKVFATIIRDMADGSYVDPVNDSLGDDFPKVTQISFVSTDFFDEPTIAGAEESEKVQPIDQRSGLNRLGRFTMTMMGMAAIVLIVLIGLFVKSRKKHRARKAKRAQKIVIIDEVPLEPSESSEPLEMSVDENGSIIPPPYIERPKRMKKKHQQRPEQSGYEGNLDYSRPN